MRAILLLLSLYMIQCTFALWEGGRIALEFRNPSKSAAKPENGPPSPRSSSSPASFSSCKEPEIACSSKATPKEPPNKYYLPDLNPNGTCNCDIQLDSRFRPNVQLQQQAGGEGIPKDQDEPGCTPDSEEQFNRLNIIFDGSRIFKKLTRDSLVNTTFVKILARRGGKVCICSVKESELSSPDNYWLVQDKAGNPPSPLDCNAPELILYDNKGKNRLKMVPQGGGMTLAMVPKIPRPAKPVNPMNYNPNAETVVIPTK